MPPELLVLLIEGTASHCQPRQRIREGSEKVENKI